jgi:hypothetical protein
MRKADEDKLRQELNNAKARIRELEGDLIETRRRAENGLDFARRKIVKAVLTVKLLEAENAELKRRAYLAERALEILRNAVYSPEGQYPIVLHDIVDAAVAEAGNAELIQNTIQTDLGKEGGR